MIHLLTGLPGSGKSLRTVYYIDKFLQEGRPVYCCGVDGISLPGVMELSDPNAWESLPDGSVIVVDEAQKLWPSRRGADPIPPVRALSEHRHQGKDFVLVTQHPAMMDSYVRRLVGRHEHLLRLFGVQAAKIFSWNEVQDDPSSNSARELSEQSMWAYPKHLFGAYKSATIHTVKRRIPKALIVIAATAVLIPALAWSAYATITGWSEDPETTEAPAQAESLGLPSLSAQAGRVPRNPQPIDYAAQFTPRIAGVAWSAPVYDRFEVQDYPRPHCVIAGDQRKERITCRCYTQQVTPMDMPDRMCIQIARFGTFDPRRAPPETRDPEPDNHQGETWTPELRVSGAHSGMFDRSLQPRFVSPDVVASSSSR